VLRVNAGALTRINANEAGISVSTLTGHTPIMAGQSVAWVRIAWPGVPAAVVARVEAVTRDCAPVLAIRGESSTRA
jgi:hypothetical protein